MSTPPRSVVLTATAAFGVGHLVARRTLAVPAALPFAAAALLVGHTVDVANFAIMMQIDCNSTIQRWRGVKAASVLDADRMRFRCWPALIDRNNHMNNAKYVRVCNYARRRFWQRNGVWQFCSQLAPQANLIVTASTIRYRKEIGLFDSFDVLTRLLSWDTSCLYLEHRFLRPSDGFVLAVCFVKYRLVGDALASHPNGPLPAPTSGVAKDLAPATLLAAVDDACASLEHAPPMPAELEAWLEYDRLSSGALRKEAGLRG